MSHDTQITERPMPPLFYGLRLWWHESMWNDRKAATLRWRMNNATEPQECWCGAHGTVAEELEGFRGDVKPLAWTCDAHVGMEYESNLDRMLREVNQSPDADLRAAP